MKNLHLLTERLGSLFQPSTADAAAATHTTTTSSSSSATPTTIDAVALDSPSQVLYAVTSDHLFYSYSPLHSTIQSVVSLRTTDDTAAAAAVGDEQNRSETEDGLLRAGDKVVSLTYLPEYECCIAVSKFGNLLTIQTTDSNVNIDITPPVESVGFISDGIDDASVSPDQELLAISTSVGKLLLLTLDYDVLYELPIAGDHAESAHASDNRCSWRGDGQYIVVSSLSGSSGKPQRKLRVFTRNAELSSRSDLYDAAPSNDSNDTTATASKDGLSDCTSWRPSGNWITCTQRRTIDAKRNVIKNEVIFFERNGLRHGEFSLPKLDLQQTTPTQHASLATQQSEPTQEHELKQHEHHPAPTSQQVPTRSHLPSGDAALADADDFASIQRQWLAPESQVNNTTPTDADVTVIDLQWNSESDILSVTCYNHDIQEYYIQHWCTNNWHWYCKQHIALGSHGGKLQWDPEVPYRCAIISHVTGHVRWLEYCWDVNVSQETSRMVAVVDTAQVLLTPIAQQLVPPPMSSYTLRTPAPVTAIAFPECLDVEQQTLNAARIPLQKQGERRKRQVTQTPIAVLLANNTVLLYSNIEEQYRQRKPTALINLSQVLTDGDYVRHLHWLASTRVSDAVYCLLFVAASVRGDDIIELLLDSSSSTVTALYSTPIPHRQTVLRIHPYIHRQQVFVHLTDATVFTYKPVFWQLTQHALHSNDNISPILQHHSTLPSPCAYFAVTTFDHQLHTVGRDTHSKLFIDDTLISPQCSSLSLTHPSYLLFTISGPQNALFFISRRFSLEQNLTPEVRNDPHAVRMMERGSSLIAAVPDVERPRVIVQMPRGNLEAVYPRTLTLLSIHTALNAQNYYTAFCTARTNRVDLNLLYDHSPVQFLQNAERFVREIDSVEYLNLFLTAIVDSDVTDSEYTHYHELSNSQQQQTASATQQHPTDDRSALAAGLQGQTERYDLSDDGLDADTPSHAHQTRGGAAEGIDRRKVFNVKHKEKIAIEYEQQLQAADKSTLLKGESKINTVCEVLRQQFERINPQKYTLCILTTYVKQSPADYESALQLIRSMRAEEETSSAVRTIEIPIAVTAQPALQQAQKPAKAAVEAGKREQKADVFAGASGALKYIIFLADITLLYQAALGLYDFDLVLMVVQQSAFDPKEILPQIADWQKLAATPYYQRATIDLYLKRHNNAVTHMLYSLLANEAINQQEQTQRVLQLIKQHSLYSSALQQLQPFAQQEQHRSLYVAILTIYAQHLQSAKQYNAAIAAYRQAGDLQAALEAAKSAGDIAQCLILAGELQMNIDDKQSLIYSLVDVVKPSDPVAAARLLVEQCDDTDAAFELLIAAEQWAEAQRVAHTTQRLDLIETHLQPELLPAYNRTLQSLDHRYERYVYCIKRLRIIRRVKLLFPHTETELQLLDDEDRDDDLQSIVSGMTGRTNASDASESIASSMASSASSASSMFSVASGSSAFSRTTGRQLTPDEKRIQRHKQRRQRKAKTKRIKEGSPQEEAYMVDELQQLTPTPKQLQRYTALITVLTQFQHVVQATRLQQALVKLTQLITAEEQKPMPLLANGTAEQNEALVKRWKWPASSYQQPEVQHIRYNDLTAVTLPFLLTVDANQGTASVPLIEPARSLDADQIEELLAAADETEVDAIPVSQKPAEEKKRGEVVLDESI